MATYHGIMHEAILQSTKYCSTGILLELFNDLTEKLDLFDSCEFAHMDSLFYFVRDLTHVTVTLWDVFEKTGNIGSYRWHEDEDEPELVELNTAWEGLERAIDESTHAAFFALPSCDDFEVTPTLVYLTTYIPFLFKNHTIPVIPGITDVISTMRPYRHLLPFFYTATSEKWSIHSCHYTGFDPFATDEEPDWSTKDKWGDLRIWFTHHILTILFKDNTNW